MQTVQMCSEVSQSDGLPVEKNQSYHWSQPRRFAVFKWCMRVCVCARARARVCLCVCVLACMCV